MNTESVKKILIGVGGGIAAYKTLEVVSALRQAGVETHVVMSGAAQKFISPLTFAAVSGQRVITEMFPDNASHDLESAYPHLYPSTEVDAFAVIPATADLTGQLAHGLGSNMVAAAALSLRRDTHRFFAPSMNVEMWEQPVVQQNTAALEKLGWQRMGPAEGHLACGMQGAGRLADPTLITEIILARLMHSNELTGKQVLILSGPTHEHIDPVRFIGNHSSGRMGRELAMLAAARGAQVTYITGPVDNHYLPVHPSIHVQKVTSADDMLHSARGVFSQMNIIIYAAAVADYTPATVSDKKLPKQTGSLNIELSPTPDIATILNADKTDGQTAIGFALQSHDGRQKAADKLKRKHFDGIVLNYVDSLGADGSHFEFLSAHDAPEAFEEWGYLDKKTCAAYILDQAAKLNAARASADQV